MRPASYVLVPTNKREYSYFNKGKNISDYHRVKDWIEYHLYQGFDHFVIYDNDPEDHGPLESLLQPYVEAGVVTRVWNPINEPLRVKNGQQSCHIQGATGVSALHRFGFASEYFANMDIDEFFIPGTLFLCTRRRFL